MKLKNDIEAFQIFIFRNKFNTTLFSAINFDTFLDILLV